MTSTGKRNLRDLPQLFGRTPGADWHLDHYELAARARARRRPA